MSLGTRGFNELNKRLLSLSKEEATKAGQAGNRAGAVVLKNAVQREAPDGPTAEGAIQRRKRKNGKTVETPHHKIKNWVRVKKTRNIDATKVQNSVGVIKAYHASFEEFGSIHNAPNPFFQRAVDASREAVLDAIAKVLNKQLIKRGA